MVVFPHAIAPLFVGRKKSILALEEAMRSDTFILLATQKNASDDDPATEAIYEIGTLASALQLLKLPDGTVKVVVEGAQHAGTGANWQRSIVVVEAAREHHEAPRAVGLGEGLRRSIWSYELGLLCARICHVSPQKMFLAGMRVVQSAQRSPKDIALPR